MSFNIHHFWAASLVVQIHVIAALIALVVGLYVFAVRKGTPFHRKMGKAWVGTMVIVALSSFFINDIRTWGPFSAIHLLSIWTLGSLVFAIHAIRKRNVRAHEYTLKGLFVGGLLVAGGLTFVGNRLMNRIFLNPETGALAPSLNDTPGGATGAALGAFLIVFVLIFILSFRSEKPQRATGK